MLDRTLSNDVIAHFAVLGKDAVELFMDMENLVTYLRNMAASMEAGLWPVVPDLWGSEGDRLRVVYDYT